jgi:hypothetical protein
MNVVTIFHPILAQASPTTGDILGVGGKSFNSLFSQGWLLCAALVLVILLGSIWGILYSQRRRPRLSRKHRHKRSKTPIKLRKEQPF